jgi:hypothetical protein
VSISQAQNSTKRRAGDEWYTPKRIIDALGPFDLDPCAAPNLPWRTAAKQFDVYDNGLLHAKASQILFVNKRIKFVNKHGLDADFTAGFYVALFSLRLPLRAAPSRARSGNEA